MKFFLLIGSILAVKMLNNQVERLSCDVTATAALNSRFGGVFKIWISNFFINMILNQFLILKILLVAY